MYLHTIRLRTRREEDDFSALPIRPLLQGYGFADNGLQNAAAAEGLGGGIVGDCAV